MLSYSTCTAIDDSDNIIVENGGWFVALQEVPDKVNVIPGWSK